MSWILVSPAVLVCYLETLRGDGYERMFHSCGQCFALLPGFLGMCLRRAFYCGTLRSCSWECQIEFGSIISHREATVESEVFIGNYALLGRVHLKQGCLIGSRSSILSSGAHHVLNGNGHWTTPDSLDLKVTVIGAYAWVGEGTVVMFDVGEGALVSAGAVTSARVLDHVMVAGNPARFVRRLFESREIRDASDEKATHGE
ncbi:acyltransferase [Novipirellula artificiosorum]|uniref:acyltransferase n=1 Tax=Novipirellula artificiosorum TaxID=2528016 RepID=UPI0011B67F9F|nr:acyltransferase [Novipirellula artificiosorum]